MIYVKIDGLFPREFVETNSGFVALIWHHLGRIVEPIRTEHALRLCTVALNLIQPAE